MPNNELPVTKTVAVEDSITHQAGEGITAQRSPSTETPDIFANTAQPEIKQTVETVPAEIVALQKAGENVTLADVSTEGSTVTTPSHNINPNGGVDVYQTPPPTREAVVVQQTAVVEDSITHQAGDGMTAQRSPSTETPDIFDNTAQPAVKTVTQTVPTETVQRMVEPSVATTQELIEGENDFAPNMQTLSDGSVDIPRDGQ